MRRGRGLVLTGVGAICLVALSATAVTPPAISVPTAPNALSYVPGEILVRFRAPVLETKAATLRRLGAVADAEIGSTGYTRVTLDAGDDVAQALARYRRDPAVESAQPNYRYMPQQLPNDPRFGEQWALRNTGQTVLQGPSLPNNPGTVGSDLGLEPAWDLVTDCSSTVVAVIDTGINYTHVDLADNMWDGSAFGYLRHGFDFVQDDDDPMPVDGDAHGTHVAGIVAAVGNNGIGTSGVCWRARIMALRAMDAAGGRTDTVIRAMRFAVQNGARIINLSLGGDGRDDALLAEIEYARRQGVLVVAAGGNGGRDIDVSAPFYPCSFPSDNIVCVAAIDQAYAFAEFSNYGTRSIDVGAPGTNALSTRAGDAQPLPSVGWNGWQSCNGALTTASVCATGNYANLADDRLLGTIDLSAADLLGAGVTGSYVLKTADGSPPWPYTVADPDALVASYDRNGNDPFAVGGPTTYIPDVSRVSTFALSLHACLTPTCVAALRFTSDEAGTDTGPRLFSSTLHLARRGSAVYDYTGGTSMATAHTTGVAALVWAYNPSYTAADVANAVKYSGDVLSELQALTATGRALDAMEALRYINAPTGVTIAGQ